MKPIRKEVTTKNAPKTLKTRHNVTVEIARLLDSGVINIDNVFFSDETWLDTSAQERLNAQNDRVYFECGTKKCDAMGQLEQGKAQRIGGIMVHLAVSSFGGGDVLEPYFYAPASTLRQKNTCLCCKAPCSARSKQRQASGGTRQPFRLGPSRPVGALSPTCGGPRDGLAATGLPGQRIMGRR